MVWLVKDPCGIACIILAWVMLIFSHYALLTVVLLPQEDSFRKYFNISLLEVFFVLAVVAHFKTIFTDPGSIPLATAPTELVLHVKSTYRPGSLEYRCYECSSLKPRGTHHCSVCKRCITRMDHHCPWVNNCVGERNQKHFILFILYISILSFHSLTLSIGYFYDCLEASHDSSNTSCSMMNKSGRAAPGNLIMLVILTFESLLFSLFTAIMFCVQMKSLWSNRKTAQPLPPPLLTTITTTTATTPSSTTDH